MRYSVHFSFPNFNHDDWQAPHYVVRKLDVSHKKEGTSRVVIHIQVQIIIMVVKMTMMTFGHLNQTMVVTMMTMMLLLLLLLTTMTTTKMTFAVHIMEGSWSTC